MIQELQLSSLYSVTLTESCDLSLPTCLLSLTVGHTLRVLLPLSRAIKGLRGGWEMLENFSSLSTFHYLRPLPAIPYPAPTLALPWGAAPTTITCTWAPQTWKLWTSPGFLLKCPFPCRGPGRGLGFCISSQPVGGACAAGLRTPPSKGGERRSHSRSPLHRPPRLPLETRPRPCKCHFPNHHKRYHCSHFAQEKLRPLSEQVISLRSHSWEATEPGRTLWASATLERMLVGKPFSAERCPWSRSHRRPLKAAKSDVNQGESRARQALLTAGQPRQYVRPRPAAGFGAGVLPGA